MSIRKIPPHRSGGSRGDMGHAISRLTERRLSNPNLMPKSRSSSYHKNGEPWRDSRGRWYVRDKRGVVRRCDPPEETALEAPGK